MRQFLYIILFGSVTIRRGERTLTELTVGEVVGEISVLDHRPRSADVISKQQTKLLKLSGETFHQLILDMPELSINTLKVLKGILCLISKLCW